MNNKPPHWVYLSPHLDDVILSCGGLIWEQVNSGYEVEIWTIFAGESPAGELSPIAQQLHARWHAGEQPASQRREEDTEACQRLRAGWRHLDWLDCIYRRDPHSSIPTIMHETDLFQPDYSQEKYVVNELCQYLKRELSHSGVLAAPFGVGCHIDHQLVRDAALASGRFCWFYADYPYAAAADLLPHAWQSGRGQSYLWPVSQAGLHGWQRALEAYRSQISTFWGGLGEMKSAVKAYWHSGGGSILRHLEIS